MVWLDPGGGGDAWQNFRPGQATVSNARYNGSYNDGYYGGNHGDGYKGGGKGRKYDGPRGKNLETIDWNGEQIVPITKEFWVEHPAVADRSWSESERIRLRHSIHVTMRDGSDPPKPIETLDELPFPDWAIEVLHQKGFKHPTPIQVQSWPAALKGHDIIGIAETGSGKTLAYVLPMFMHIMAQPELRPGEGPVGLVLVPHRELCLQVAEDINRFAIHTPIQCAAVTGAEDEKCQAQRMLGKIDILVATPGRLISLLNQQETNLRRATFMVLDEADDLFQSSFVEQVKLVLSQVRPDRQVLLYSATWDDKVETVANEVCKCNPIQIVVGSTKLAACKDIVQTTLIAGHETHSFTPNASKMDLLIHSLQRVQDSKVLIFCNNRETVPQVVSELNRNGIACEGFASGLFTHQAQETRTQLLNRFTDPQGDLKILVCTQVLGRGHDFHDVKFVINYDMPRRMVEYVHRIGRTGRAGREGYSLTILEEEDLYMAKDLADCLRETNQVVPQWLAQAARQKRRPIRPRRTQHCASADPWVDYNGSAGNSYGNTYSSYAGNTSAGALDSWTGRGRGRRGEVLLRLAGRGLAKNRMPTARAH